MATIMNVTNNLRLDFSQQEIGLITVAQYDKNSRIFHIYFYDKGVEVTPNFAVINTKFKKPDGTYIYDYATTPKICVMKNGYAELTFTDQMCAASGIGLLQLEFQDKPLLKNSSVSLHTMNIKVNVISAPFSDKDIMSQSEVRVIDELLDKTEELSDLAKSYAVGTNGVKRPGDNTDNAKYYYEQAKSSANTAIEKANISTTNAQTSTTNANTTIRYANTSKQWAIGTSDTTSTPSDTNNSKYWSNKAENTLESKADKSVVDKTFKSVSYNNKNGNIIFTCVDGSTKTLETDLEKMAVNFGYDETTQKLTLTLEDGTIKVIDLSSFITESEYLDTDTIDFSVIDHKVSAIVKSGSIKESHLDSDILNQFNTNINLSKSYAIGTGGIARPDDDTDNSKYYKEKAGELAEIATIQATSASNSAIDASNSATASATSEANALEYKNSASSYRDEAEGFKNNAATSEANALTYKNETSNFRNETETLKNETIASVSEGKGYMDMAKSYAIGTDGEIRPEDTKDNAMWYYEQCKKITNSITGALKPMGTIEFEQLPLLGDASVGDMYSVNNDFITNENFVEGAGYKKGAGTNIYKIVIDGVAYWDCMVGNFIAALDIITDDELDELFED